MSKMSKQIKHYRTERGFSRLEVAKYCGIREKRYKRIESGLIIPSKEEINLMVHLFEVDLDKLVAGSKIAYVLKRNASVSFIYIGFISYIVLMTWFGVGLILSVGPPKLLVPKAVQTLVYNNTVTESVGGSMDLYMSTTNKTFKTYYLMELDTGDGIVTVEFDTRKLEWIDDGDAIKVEEFSLVNESNYEVYIHLIYIRGTRNGVTIEVIYDIYYDIDDLFYYFDGRTYIHLIEANLKRDISRLQF